ncbi:MAG: ATP-binding protein [Actinomycetota bacterium]
MLLAGALLPVLVFTGVVLLRLTQETQADNERRLTNSARLMGVALERELASTTQTLDVLAQSPRLDVGDLQGFHRIAQRVAERQPTWLTVLLLAPDGRQLVNTRYKWGSPLPRVNEPKSLQRVLETRRPTVGSLAKGPRGRWAFPIRVPVIRNGEVRYVLTAAVTPKALTEVVASASSPDDEWTRTIVDGNGVVVVRTREPERFMGRPATRAFLAHVASAPYGVFRDTALDGAQVYCAFSRHPESNWSVAVVASSVVVEGPGQQSLAALAGLGIAMLVLSAVGAPLLSRGVSRGMTAAAAAAEALAHGRHVPVHSSVTEIARLGEALARSADLLTHRQAERDEQVVRAEAAREESELARAEAEAANRVKDEFLAMLGHELRNPLAPIVTALEVLRLRGQGETREIELIRRQVRHLSRLVDDLLDISRITRGKIELKQERVEIAAVVQRAVEMASPLFEQRGHNLTVDVPVSGLVVHGDPVRLAQIVANLLTNAAHYTPDAGCVQVCARPVGAEMELAVTDNGQGMSPEVLARVFDLFVQGPRTIARQEGGLGIGLSIVRSLAGLHGGRIEADSAGPGAGSTFRVYLPLAPSPLTAADPLRSARPRGQDDPGGLRILVVDDNQDAAETLAMLFEGDGHEAVVAFDGPGALKACDRFRPDVAVLDLGLPAMDGYELAAALQEKLGDPAPVFLAVTGYGQERDPERSRQAGFSRHFMKPVDPAVLLRMVSEIAGVA